MNGVRLRDPYEVPLNIFSVLVDPLIITLTVAGALLAAWGLI